MKQKYILSEISKLKIDIKSHFVVFLKGDLAAGKTTLTKYILNEILKVQDNIISPTYTYYNKYMGSINGDSVDIFHFDLYRLKNYDEFFAIGGEDIFDNNNGIILVEWSELIEKYYTPDLTINLNKTDIEDEREIEMIYK